MELWCVVQPFDTLLLKYWPNEQLNSLIDVLSSRDKEPEIAEALSPIGYSKCQYYENGIVGRIIREFCVKPSLCTKNKFCQDVYRHSTGMKCVTAAAIRKRLYPKFDRYLGTLHNAEFQLSLMTPLSGCIVRHKLGVLLIHCPPASIADVTVANESVEASSSVVTCRMLTEGAPGGIPEQFQVTTLSEHLLKVLYDNFYLFTAPLEPKYVATHAAQVRNFVGNQIFRNADVIVIMVDDAMVAMWEGDGAMRTMILQSLGWDVRLRIVIVAVSPRARAVVSFMYESMLRRPWLVGYEQLVMAPSGGFVSFIRKACRLGLGGTIVKYCHRMSVVLSGLEEGPVAKERCN